MPSTRPKDYLLLLLVVAAGYWVLFVYTIPNDLLDCWLPWRHFISKSFHSGIVPLWNPYQQMGYPVYADLQGPLFSLENFLTGGWSHMDLSTLQAILFGYLCLAAVGMYELGQYLLRNRTAALAVAMAYVLGGFFNLHLQHFFTLVSAALMPWACYLVLKFLQNPQWKYLLALTLVFHLLFTTGNQTFNVINIHVLAFVFVRKIVVFFRNQQSQQAWKLITRSVWLLFFIAISILPVLLAFWQTRNYVDRYDGLNYSESLVNSMTPVSFQSLVNPLLSTQSHDYLGTDLTMSGYFFGFVSLGFALVYFVFAPGRLKWLFLVLLVFFALMSLGVLTPLHYWMYKIDPLLRLFRFPAYYMYYVYFILVLTAGAGLKMSFAENNAVSSASSLRPSWLNTPVPTNQISSKKITAVFFALALLVIAIAFFNGFEKGTFFHHLRKGEFFESVKNQSLAVTCTFSALLILFPGITTLFLYRWKKKKSILIGGIALEMIVTCNLGVFLVSIPQPVSKTNDFIAALPKNFALPANTLTADEKLRTQLPTGTWRNYHAYFNLVSPEFFNSFYIHHFIEWKNDPDIDKSLLWKNKRENSVQLKVFEPGRMVFKTPLGRREKLMINQLNFPYWKLYLNNRPVPLPAGTILNIDAPAGTHEIKLVFENPAIVFCFWFSLTFTALVGIVILFLQFQPRTALVMALIFAGLCIKPVLPFLFKNNQVKTVPGEKPKGDIIVNKAKTEIIPGSGIYDARFELNQLLYALLTTSKEKLVYIDSGNFNPPVIEQALKVKFDHIDQKSSGTVTRYTASGRKNKAGTHCAFDLSHHLNTGWNIPTAQVVVDSLQQRQYCLLNDTWNYGPGIEPANLPKGCLFFAIRSVHEVQLTEGELLLVLEVIKAGKSQIYQAQPLHHGQEMVVFYPGYTFTGDEKVKMYYWLNGKGQARISAQDLWVIPYE